MEVESDFNSNTDKANRAGTKAKIDDERLMWIEKYRPEKLDDLVSQTYIIETIQKYIEKKNLPHLLFYGPPGTGKTSTILALAKQLYGKQAKSMVQELNASDDRGIDVVREQIKNFASTQNVFGLGFKLIILDEADSMTQAAQAALRRVMEKYTRNVRFCIICNYATKIIPAIQSRCTKFRFSPLSSEQIKGRVGFVIQNEGIRLGDGGLEAVLKLGGGDMRRVLNILQGCHSAYDVIDKDAVYNCTGQPRPEDVQNILDSMLNDEYSVALDYISKIKNNHGLALQDIITSLLEFVNAIDFPDQTRIFIIDKMSDIEYKLGNGASERTQLSALIGAFKVAVELAA